MLLRGAAELFFCNKGCDPLPPPYPLLLLVAEEVPLLPAEYLLLEW